MKSFNMKRICTFLCAIVCSTALFADVEGDQLIAQSKSKSRARTNNAKRDPNTWAPYFMKSKVAEPMLTSSFQQNVGIGFLYFSTIRGNLQPNTAASIKTNKKLRGHLMYNRTPLMEYSVATDILHWLKVGLSYQHQGGVVVQTRPQALLATAGNTLNPPDLTAHVRLDTVQAKVYFMLPFTLVWKCMYYEPYFAAAVGPGWQSWVAIDDSSFFTRLRPKYSANCVWTLDFGFKLRKALPHYVMSFVAGCKYNQWGQARSMGKLQQQYQSGLLAAGGVRPALRSPVSVKTLFQFAPYVGVQFNF